MSLILNKNVSMKLCHTDDSMAYETLNKIKAICCLDFDAY